jgi:hypothetical protein
MDILPISEAVEKKFQKKRDIRINKKIGRRKDTSLIEQTLAVLPVFEFVVK